MLHPLNHYVFVQYLPDVMERCKLNELNLSVLCMRDVYLSNSMRVCIYIVTWGRNFISILNSDMIRICWYCSVNWNKSFSPIDFCFLFTKHLCKYMNVKKGKIYIMIYWTYFTLGERVQNMCFLFFVFCLFLLLANIRPYLKTRTRKDSNSNFEVVSF